MDKRILVCGVIVIAVIWLALIGHERSWSTTTATQAPQGRYIRYAVVGRDDTPDIRLGPAWLVVQGRQGPIVKIIPEAYWHYWAKALAGQTVILPDTWEYWAEPRFGFSTGGRDLNEAFGSGALASSLCRLPHGDETELTGELCTSRVYYSTR